jgi:hypothetical protein
MTMQRSSKSKNEGLTVALKHLSSVGRIEDNQEENENHKSSAGGVEKMEAWAVSA